MRAGGEAEGYTQGEDECVESGVKAGAAILTFRADQVSPLAGKCTQGSRKWVVLVARSKDTRKVDDKKYNIAGALHAKS